MPKLLVKQLLGSAMLACQDILLKTCQVDHVTCQMLVENLADLAVLHAKIPCQKPSGLAFLPVNIHCQTFFRFDHVACQYSSQKPRQIWPFTCKESLQKNLQG